MVLWATLLIVHHRQITSICLRVRQMTSEGGILDLMALLGVKKQRRRP